MTAKKEKDRDGNINQFTGDVSQPSMDGAPSANTVNQMRSMQ